MNRSIYCNSLICGLLIGAASSALAQQDGERQGGARRGNRGAAANYPAPVQGDYVIKDFKFRSGETLPELKLHYMTVGTPQKDASGKVTNAIYAMHGTTGNGNNFLVASWAGELYGPGQILDGTKYFIIMSDGIGHGKSSKPSDGLKAKFPHYGYQDMIDAEYKMLNEGLGVNHLRLVIGTSMGGMHSWLWGSMYPDYMDALMPLASLPTQISGRNRMWRRVIIDGISLDPEYNDGNYTKQINGMRIYGEISLFMGGNAVRHLRSGPTLAQADQALDRGVASYMRADANDVLYAFRASEDYDPGPGLPKIKAPLVAINFADDLINPPEQGVLEEAIKKVPHGKAITYPMSDQTAGHGTHTNARVWKEHLAELMKETEPKQ